MLANWTFCHLYFRVRGFSDCLFQSFNAVLLITFKYYCLVAKLLDVLLDSVNCTGFYSLFGYDSCSLNLGFSVFDHDDWHSLVFVFSFILVVIHESIVDTNDWKLTLATLNLMMCK